MNKEIIKERLDVFNSLKWKFALKNSDIGLWDWSYNDNNETIFFSQESKKILGFTSKNDGKNFGNNPQDWNERVHPEDKENYFLDLKNHAEGVTDTYVNQHRVLCNDGKYKWILDTGKIIERDYNNKPTRIIGTHRDITKRINNNNKITKTLDLVTRQNRILQNFAHIVTHNLKEHSGNLENLLELYKTADTAEEKKEIIDALTQTTSNLDETIKDLTSIVSVQSKKQITFEKIYIGKYIEKVFNVLANSIKKSNATINNFIDDDLFIFFSPAYMESIIQNLITNAIKYKHPDRDPIINISCSIVNGVKYVNFSDNGIGIDLDKYGNALFGLYKTFHNNEDAGGVGLYLIKSQIEEFGGKIEAASEPNAGTTFTIMIPNKRVYQ